MPEPQYVKRSYAGGDAVAQLVQEIGATDTSFTIAPVTGWVEEDGSPLGTSGPFTVGIDRFTPQLEKICCRSINLTTGLVTVFVDTDGWSGRGYDGTNAQSHIPDGSTAGVQTCWSAAEAREANQAVFDVLGGGGASLVGVPIGTSIDFRGTPATLPANFLLENAAAVSRTTYSALFTALTIAATGTTTNGSATITGLDATKVSYMTAGMKITGANLGAAGTVYTILTASGTTVTLTSGVGVVAGTLGNLVIYPHGAGDGSTTFNLPDARGKVTAGFGLVGTNAAPTLYVGTTSGEQNHTLVQGELSVALGSATSTVTEPNSGQGHKHSISGQFVDSTTSSSYWATTDGGIGQAVTLNDMNYSTTGITVGTTITNASGGNAHNNMQPYSVATKIIRAL